MRTPRPALLLLAALALALGACGDDGGGDGGSESGSTYETVADLNEDLSEAGVACVLEYEGLADDSREISQCEIDGELAIINVWYDDELKEATVDGATEAAPVAHGANWTVAVETAATAGAIAEALDGTSTP